MISDCQHVLADVDLDSYALHMVCDTMALLVGHQTCDLQVVGLSPSWAPLWQATYTCVPLSPSSITWYRPIRVIS